ncbi:MAG: class I SAM-dependent methyltransferase [Acidobacteria bacterium]|nr:class I SAM-dependent methyltransferase [Acidobacteriota bacterium]
MRVLLFTLLEIVFFPLQLIGTLIYTCRIRFVNRPRGISGTAYEPYMTRLLLHHIGSRTDAAAERIAPHLPALSPVVLRLLVDTLVLAARWSGFRGSFLAYPGPRPSTLMTFISHRTHFFDGAVAAAAAAESPIRQFVVLGAGWDTRFYGPLPDGADLRAPDGRYGGEAVRCFEVDEPPTQAAKVEALRAAGVDSGHVVFAPTDFNQQSWMASLKAHGFDPDLPTFILWEGVTMYLDDAAIDKTLGEVAGLAPGSRIAFDFLSRELVFARKPFVVLGNYAKYAMKAFYGESWLFGISTATPARERARKFIEARGLEFRSYEAFGGEAERGTPLGGLIVAGVPERTATPQ